MKSSLHCCLLAALWVVACNHRDSDLFSSSGASSTPHTGGSTAEEGNGGNDAQAGTGAPPSPSGGMTPAQAGTGSGGAQPSGGTSGSSAAGTAGSGPPEPMGTAGSSDGAGGTPEPPAEPVCGNGVIEAGEQCDDGGHVGQDGCDANCQVVCSQHGAGTTESSDHHCYKGYDAAPFQGAQQDCVNRGGHLATLSSDEEDNIARKFVNNSKWIGGLEDVELTASGTGDYGWITGEPFTYTNWAAGEPNRLPYRCNGGGFNSECYEHCITLLPDGTWADRRCDTSDGYVCEWDPPSATP